MACAARGNLTCTSPPSSHARKNCVTKSWSFDQINTSSCDVVSNLPKLYRADGPPSCEDGKSVGMSSYTITLWCGCRVYVSCDPRTRTAHARILEHRGPSCPDRRHQVGTKLRLWEMLPDPRVDETW